MRDPPQRLVWHLRRRRPHRLRRGSPTARGCGPSRATPPPPTPTPSPTGAPWPAAPATGRTCAPSSVPCTTTRTRSGRPRLAGLPNRLRNRRRRRRLQTRVLVTVPPRHGRLAPRMGRRRGGAPAVPQRGGRLRQSPRPLTSIAYAPLRPPRAEGRFAVPEVGRSPRRRSNAHNGYTIGYTRPSEARTNRSSQQRKASRQAQDRRRQERIHNPAVERGVLAAGPARA